MNRDRFIRKLYTTLGFCLLAFSFYVLNRELARYNLEDIISSLAAINGRQLMAATAFSILSCFAIASYDFIAFRWLKHRLKIERILFTSFITYAISNTTGFTLLIGGSIRYRFYSLWGVPARYVAKITAFGNITFWLGLFTLTGITFVVNPLQLPNPINLDSLVIRCMGIAALSSIGIYLYFCQLRKKLKIRNQIFGFPKLTTSLSQIIVFSVDWALAAAILFSLLPDYPDKSYFSFFNIYLLAMAASIISNIPGGLGVFETVIIFLLPKTLLAPDILSSLLIYRAVRFLFPLSIALFLISLFEIKRRF